MQKLMQSIPGVVGAVSGYANGHSCENPSYEMVCTGNTGFKETVKVEYDPQKISLDAILFAYFAVIDPSVRNRQGHDVGPQYQTGIYYADEASKRTAERIAGIEKERNKVFEVEIGPLESFYDAEEYHQKYLDKNPSGYCHIPREKIDYLADMVFDPAEYQRPAKEIIEKKLTDIQFAVTQRAATEPPFQNELWEHSARGIYVDVVTGEPLFSSKDKFKSSCGWPSFSKGIDRNSLVRLEDLSHNMKRTEVRSRAGNSHLGHVFERDFESPNGVRYCINGAALRFVPYDRMEEEGYGKFKQFV
jgi:methionine-R-sulfoxide reductase/methionine-S-sulfoxide reductase